MKREDEPTSTVRLGEISSPAGANEFTKIVAWDGLSEQILWDGTKHTAEIIVGRSWELHCYYTGYNADGWWNMTVSISATEVPSTYQKQARGDRYEGASVPEDHIDFNMGDMPDAPVTIRVKLWSSNYYTVQKPPSDEW